MIDLAAAKQQLNIEADDTTHDVELQEYVGAAIGGVERYAGLFGAVRTVTGERHQLCRACKVWMFNKPVQSVTTVERVDGTQVWDVLDLDVDTEFGLIRVISGPLLNGLVKFTYQAGHVDPPKPMTLSARIVLQHLWTTQRGVMGGLTGGDLRAALDTTADNLIGAGRGYAVPKAVWELLGEPEVTGG